MHGCSCDDDQNLDGTDVAADTADVAGGDVDASVDMGLDSGPSQTDVAVDGSLDVNAPDVNSVDVNSMDGGSVDVQSDAPAATDLADLGGSDADAGVESDVGDAADTPGDGGTDAVADVAVADDVGMDAAVEPDASGPAGDCVSGADGTRAVRFRWRGNGPNSTAYVGYETNQLPDTSRWHVSAYSSNFSYSPVYTDTFLAEGGLELSGTVFIDIELSTAGLGALSGVTLAVYGRSYDTTSAGSFEWQSFSGSGAAASGSVANSAPYQWYLADATAALPAGDDGILLRISAGPPSRSLVVNRVEICFDEI